MLGFFLIRLAFDEPCLSARYFSLKREKIELNQDVSEKHLNRYVPLIMTTQE